MVTFKKITSTKPVADYISDTLTRALHAGRQTLWLVPGGSSIAIAIEVSKRLHSQNLQNLAVTLTDERYGQVGHADSNWLQLQDGGFDLPGATLLPILNGQDRAQTTEEFDKLLGKALEHADYAFGFFGIGPDGHTAGILPNSPAVYSQHLAASYDAGNFERITVTPLAIARLDEAVTYAVGKPKWPVLEQLEKTSQEFTKQPAQALKTVPGLTIFNDAIGEDV